MVKPGFPDDGGRTTEDGYGSRDSESFCRLSSVVCCPSEPLHEDIGAGGAEGGKLRGVADRRRHDRALAARVAEAREKICRGRGDEPQVATAVQPRLELERRHHGRANSATAHRRSEE